MNFDIKEGLPGQFSGGIGYSESQSILLNGSFVHSNFMGTGNRVAAEINARPVQQGLQPLAHRSVHDDRRRVAHAVGDVPPARPVHAVVVGLRDRDRHARRRLRLADHRVPVAARRPRGAAVGPVHRPERERGRRRSTGCRTTATPYTEVNNDRHPADRVSRTTAPSSTPSSCRPAGASTRATARSSPTAARVTASTSATRSRAATSSSTRSTTTTCSSCRSTSGSRSCRTRELGYGDALGDTTSLPPYRSFFAGGPESVRGYRESRLGPKDSFGNPYGGNLKLTSQFELLLPMPEKWRNSARFSVFFDIGNVFSTDDIDVRRQGRRHARGLRVRV